MVKDETSHMSGDDRLNDAINNHDNNSGKILNSIDEKNDINRLDLLEEALKESIALTVQAELQARLKEEALNAANRKILALESALALPTFHCMECQNLRKQSKVVGQSLTLLQEQRNHHLEDVFDLKIETFLSALSEIDEKAARLEMSSCAEDRQRLSELQKERDALLKRITYENERRVETVAQIKDAEQWERHCGSHYVKATLNSTDSQFQPQAGLIWPSRCDEELTTPGERPQPLSARETTIYLGEIQQRHQLISCDNSKNPREHR